MQWPAFVLESELVRLNQSKYYKFRLSPETHVCCSWQSNIADRVTLQCFWKLSGLLSLSPARWLHPVSAKRIAAQWTQMASGDWAALCRLTPELEVFPKLYPVFGQAQKKYMQNIKLFSLFFLKESSCRSLQQSPLFSMFFSNMTLNITVEWGWN